MSEQILAVVSEVDMLSSMEVEFDRVKETQGEGEAAERRGKSSGLWSFGPLTPSTLQ